MQAYKCHVFLDWRELRPTENYRWDLLCDSLNGRGVPNLDEALLALELAPLHQSLVSLLEADVVESFALVASSEEALPACGQEAETSTPAAQLMQRLEGLSLRFAGEGLAIYARKTGQPHVDANDAWLAICAQLQAAAGLPGMEAEFSEPWSSEAKAVLPSSSSGAPRQGDLGSGARVLCSRRHGAKHWRQGHGCHGVGALRSAAPARASCPGLLAGAEITEDGWRAAARVRLAFLGLTLTPAKPVKGGGRRRVRGPSPRDSGTIPTPAGCCRVNESGGRVVLQQGAARADAVVDAVARSSRAWAASQGGTGARPRGAKSAPKSTLKSIGAIEQAVEEACEQAEESGYRIGKKKEAAAKPAKREKGALAK